MIQKKTAFLMPVIALAIVAAGCSDEVQQDQDATINQYVTYDDGNFYTPWQSKTFTKINLDGSSIQADGSNVATLVIEGSTVTIKGAGTYVIEGSLTDGQIVVDTAEAGTVRLVLNGVDITSSTSAAIFVKQSDKTVISLEDGTENRLTDGLARDEKDEALATLYSKDDLTINGDGNLSIQANAADGIAGKDRLLITGGNIQIAAADDGILGRDLFAMQNAKISIDAAGDGVKSTNDEKEDKGNIVLESGELTIKGGGDGIAAVNQLVVLDGTYNIVTGGGSPETIESEGDFGFGGMPSDFGNVDMNEIQEMIENGEMPEMPGGGQMPSRNGTSTTGDGTTSAQGTPPDMNGGETQGNPTVPNNGNTQFTPPTSSNREGTQSTPPNSNEGNTQFTPPSGGQMPGENQSEEDSDSTPSTKGIKAVNAIHIYGGTFNIDSLDDAVHSDGDITIEGGEITANTGDDGIHANNTLKILDGTIQITKSYEGLEGKNIFIEGGHTELTAADDGVNISGGATNGGFGQMPPNANVTNSNATEETEESLLTISGGYLLVNADGDGLDSNGSILMTGGTAIVYGPTASMNGPLDYDGTFDLQGGMLIASGSSGMALSVSETSTQNTVMMTFEQMLEAETTVTVTNETGEVLIAVQPAKSFQSIVISSPELAVDNTLALGYGGTLTGELENGVTTNATVENILAKTEFTFASKVIFLNKDGLTDAPSEFGGMGGAPGGGGRGGFPNMQNGNGGMPGNPSNQNQNDSE
jgi:hypothetical protein